MMTVMIILPNGSQKHIQIYRYAGTLQTEAAPFALGNPPTHTRPIFLFYPLQTLPEVIDARILQRWRGHHGGWRV